MLAGDNASILLAVLKDPELAAAIADDGVREEDATDAAGEEGSRRWRRELTSTRSARAPSHSTSGGRFGGTASPAADAAASSPLSYYQQQQLKYGRGRRGSTGVAGEAASCGFRRVDASPA